MYYILPESSESGAYSAPQTTEAPGLVELPEEFLPEFFKEGKQAAGFVTIEHDGAAVTSCVWNEEAYRAYLATLPPEEPPDPAWQRERAYEEERLVEWPEGGGTYLTVTEAAQQWQYYAAEGNTANTVRLQELIAAAKAVIRERYPDAPADAG